MEGSEKKEKKIRFYWLIWLIILVCLSGGVFAIVYKFQSVDGQGGVKEPRDFVTEVDPEYTWDLTTMYKDLNGAKEAYKQLEDQMQRFSKYEGQLDAPESFKQAIQLYEAILISEEKLRIYANLRRDIAIEDGEVSDFLAEIEQLDSNLSEVFGFFKPELAKLSNAKLEKYLTFKETAHYSDLIEEILYNRQSILSEREDRLIGFLNDLDLTFENNYQAFWNRYDVNLKAVAYDNYYSPNEEKRFEATRASLQKQIDAVEVLASNLEGKVKYDNLIAKAYEYDTDLEMVLSQDGITMKNYKAYEQATEKNLPLYHRWVGLKQKMLGLKRPYQYHDDQLSLVDQAQNVSYEEAVKNSREAFKPLGDEYLAIFDEAISNRWIDVYPREDKYSGSYTWGAYDSHPYMLLNYIDNISSASTFAHEMGHAVHSYFSEKNQPFNSYENSIFKAEIASTTNEVLFLEQQLKHQEGKARQEVLIQYIDLIVGTIFEQMKASDFEKAIHAAQLEGKDLDGNFLKQTWQDLNAKYYGPNYKITELDGYGWTDLDHLYWNFYMYKYATGLASGYSIANQLLENPVKTQPVYLKFLKSGNTIDPIEELKTLNVDLTDGSALDSCYAKLTELLNELEATLK